MKNETIVDRVVERLKAAPLGDLITEEDLHDIVKQAIPKTFFESRKIEVRDSWHTDIRETQPLIIEIMSGLLKDAAERAVSAWLNENPDMIADYWKQVCDAGLLKYVREIQDAQATESVRHVLRGWASNINEERSRNGMSPLPIPF